MSEPEFYKLLAAKLYTKFSWEEWKVFRKLTTQPQYRKKLQQIYTTLNTTPFKQLPTLVGAHLDIFPLIQELLQEYINNDALLPYSNKPFDDIGIKLALDNTYLFKKKMEGLYISLIDVANPQHIKHQAITAIAMIGESNANNLCHYDYFGNRNKCAHFRQREG